MATRRQNEQELKEVTHWVNELRGTLSATQRELSAAEKRQRNLVSALAPNPSNGIGVSDHALLRYLEKRFDLDLPALKAEILTPDRIGAIKAGAHKISVDGLKYIVKDNTVVTVMD